MKKKSFGYYVGYAFGTILVACAATAIIASTIKFLFWLF